MATSSKAIDRYLRLAGRYLWSRGLFTAVAVYMIFSVILNATTGIDICIPCLWSTIFGVKCPGCGLTTATVFILKFQFAAAWEANRLAFIILPVGAFFVYQDVSRFLKRQAAAAEPVAA